MKIKEIKEKIIIDENETENSDIPEEVVSELRKADDNIIKKEKQFRNFQRLVLNLFIILFIIWALFFFAIGLTSAPNDDMRPAFHAGDLVIYDKINSNPGINDIVAFQKGGTTYLGRVIAKGGDTVEILKTGGIKINGSAYTESYIYEGTLPLTTVEYPLKLEEDEFFVLVDSREKGEDSRYFGAVKKDEILGRVAGVFRRSGF